MKESFLVSFLIFFANINEHFRESNDYNKNSFSKNNLYIQMDQTPELPYFLNRLYNDYAIGLENSITIYNMLNIYSITNLTQDYFIEPESFVLINNKKIFEKIINDLIEDNFYNLDDCIVLLVEDNILSELTSFEVKKYKNIKNFVIITYDDISIYNKLIEIKDDKDKIQKILLKIDITYSEYPTTGYIVFICILFTFINIILFLFCSNYLKIGVEIRLGIHIIIFVVYFFINIFIIFLLIEIILSKKSLVYKLIPKGYFVVKIIKVVFIVILKNSFMLIFLLISRAYCILFFDNEYKNRYVNQFLIIALLDYCTQLILSVFNSKLLDITNLTDFYNIIYYIIIGIYIFYKGKNISIGLILISNSIDSGLIAMRTQDELNIIKNMINEKIKIIRKINFCCFIFCLIGILSPLFYDLFSSFYKGNTIFDLIILIQYISSIIFISKIFYPRQLLPYYTMIFEQLFHGIPEEFLNEYLYRFNKENYMKEKNISYIEKSPIIIINPFQILNDNNSNNNCFGKQFNCEYNNAYKIKDMNIINSFIEKGQIGFLNKDN